MQDDIKPVRTSLKNGIDFNKSINFARFTPSRPLRRAQINFIILCFAYGLPVFKPSYFIQYGISKTTAHQYLRELVTMEYINKIGIGQYQLSEASHQLVKVFQEEYIRRSSLPLSWK